MSSCPSLHVFMSMFHVFISMYLCLYVHFSMSVSPFLHVSMAHVCLYVSMSMFPRPCLYVSRIPQTKNGTKRTTATFVYLLQREKRNGKLLFICCKWKRKWKVVFLGLKTVQSNPILLFQHTCHLHMHNLVVNWKVCCPLINITTLIFHFWNVNLTE